MVSDFDDAVRRATELGAPVVLAPHRNPPPGEGNGPGHRELWVGDLDGYTVILASADGEAYEAWKRYASGLPTARRAGQQ